MKLLELARLANQSCLCPVEKIDLRFVAKIAELAVMAEREACAKICEEKAQRCESRTTQAETEDEITDLRSRAWDFSVLAEDIRCRPHPTAGDNPMFGSTSSEHDGK